MVARTADVVVIGSGPGGLAAAVEARKNGAENVLIVERDRELGGILQQCIHNGFGLELFGEDLPGPTYAQRFIDQIPELGIHTLLDTMVLDLTPDRRISATSKSHGYLEIEARSVVLAMGCRERTRAQIRIPGTRPAGVYTAGTAQRFVNIEGYVPGNRFVILGSGDIGMIMARRLTFEGARVERVLELMPYLTGLTRNFVQCLQDFDIPLQLGHTVARIIGNQRVEAIEAVKVDERRCPIAGTEEIIPCDTLLLSVGLIPENEISQKAGVEIDPITSGPYVDESFQTSVPGIFAAGNVVHVYDLVDWVTDAGYAAGRSAARFAANGTPAPGRPIRLLAGDNVRYVVPQSANLESLTDTHLKLQMRVTRPIESKVWVEARDTSELVFRSGRRYVRPGEMVTLKLPCDKLRDVAAGSGRLTVGVVER